MSAGSARVRILHGAAHLGGKGAGFSDRTHRGVAGDDALDQRRAGARQPGDEYRRGGGIARWRGGNPVSCMGVDDPVDLRDLGGEIVGDRAMLQVAAGIDMIERAVVHLQVFAFLAEREAQHDLARPRQPAVADQRFHFLDMIAICGLDAQVRAQIMGKTITRVESDGGVAMRLGLLQRPGHPLGRRQIEQILRHVGAGGDRAQEEFLRPRCRPSRPKIAPQASSVSGALPIIFAAASAASKARRRPRRKRTGILRAE